MTYQELINKIKSEARVETDTEFDELITGILNELYIEATEQEKVPELRITEQYAPINYADGFEMPDGYLKIHSVRYYPENFEEGWDLASKEKVIEPAPPGFYGYPKSYEIQGDLLLIDPTTNTGYGDVLALTFYQKPIFIDAITIDNQMQIPRLEPYLVRSGIARVLMYHEKLQGASAMASLAAQGGQSFQAENEATTVDQ